MLRLPPISGGGGHNPPNFGFWISPGPQTGDYVIDLLVPNDAVNAASLTFNISGTDGGLTDSSLIPSTAATLFSSTAWTSGGLDSYLGISGGASPANPIGAYLDPSETALDPGATGFYVYQADLGQNELQASAGSGPLLALDNSVPVGTYIVGYCEDCSKKSNNVATANSGAILETNGIPVPEVPEPNSLLWLAPALLGLAGCRSWMKRRA